MLSTENQYNGLLAMWVSRISFQTHPENMLEFNRPIVCFMKPNVYVVTFLVGTHCLIKASCPLKHLKVHVEFDAECHSHKQFEIVRFCLFKITYVYPT